jgi:hypothetical protein
LILASILTATHLSFDSMFTSEFWKSAILAIVGTGVFILVYRFQPWHGFGLAVPTLLLFAGMSTLVVDSMLSPRPPGRLDTTIQNKTIRRPTGGGATPSPAPAQAPAPAPAPAKPPVK